MFDTRVSTAIPALSLGTLASVSVGTTCNLGVAAKTFTLQTVVTGAPSVVSFKLQGSLDNVNWYDLATSATLTSDAQFSVDKPAQYLRLNLLTLTTGTAPTVTGFVGVGS